MKQRVETNTSNWILDYIDTIEGFPRAGISFKWYSKLLLNPTAFNRVVEEFAARYRNSGIDVIIGIDSRGFIFGAPLAYRLKIPFVVIRKAGKLPGKVEKIDYTLEYGQSFLEIERDCLQPNQQVLIVDDILATGGTILAACSLVERLGAHVKEVACLIELPSLNARKKIPHPLFSLISIEGASRV